MAGLKKSKRQKDTGSPNMVLVLFLILFIISNLVLGLWLYFTYDERNNALKAKTEADKVAKSALQAMEVYQIVANDLRQAIGQRLDPNDKASLDIKRKALLEDGYKDDPNRAAFVKLLTDLHKELEFEDDKGVYKQPFQAKLKEKYEEAEKNLASFKTAQKELEEARAKFQTLEQKADAYYTATTARFAKEQKAVLAASKAPSEEMKTQIAKNEALNTELGTAQAAAQKKETSLKKEITELKAQLTQALEKKDDTSVARDSREPHALLLDVSMGKPLWDLPVGKVTRVHAGAKVREVTIDLGSAKGVRAHMTFNVFAPSKYAATRADKQLKGTIEVVRVLGPHTSLARITATFDPDFPIHEGDLLFNLFWGTHVAITGYANVTGIPTDSPAEQMRQLSDFMYLLQRQGIIVDAYLDLTDGQMKGAITGNTRFLIRGDDLRLDPKELEAKEPRAERAMQVNNAVATMRKDAVEKGVFVISARNFAATIGYHPPAALTHDDTAFRPTLPAAGSVIPAVGAPPPRDPAAAPEKKDAEDKMEKDKGG